MRAGMDGVSQMAFFWECHLSRFLGRLPWAGGGGGVTVVTAGQVGGLFPLIHYLLIKAQAGQGLGVL